jgi:hypothetical protein
MGVEIIREDPRNRPPQDIMDAMVRKAANLKAGDFVRYRTEANAERERYNGSYALKDKDGNEIKALGQVAMARPREVNERIKKENSDRANFGHAKAIEKQAEESGIQEVEKLRRGRKKHFTA